MKRKSLRNEIFKLVKEKYGTEPDYPWARTPEYAVLRHSDNRKWYGIIMRVKRSTLGLEGEEYVDIINVKPSDELMVDMLTKEKGFLRGYHMNHSSWVSVLLDGTVPMKRISPLIDLSFKASESAKAKNDQRPPKEWIIPANPRYYDIVHAFDSADVIDWKQGKGIKVGDTVFMYAAAPVSAIIYKCAVIETDIPYDYRDGGLTIAGLMKIQLKGRYPADRFTFKVLGEMYDIFAVRGPRGIPEALSRALNNDQAQGSKQ